jgi:hypothetical protein
MVRLPRLQHLHQWKVSTSNLINKQEGGSFPFLFIALLGSENPNFTFSLTFYPWLTGRKSFTSLLWGIKQKVKGFTKIPSDLQSLFVVFFLWLGRLDNDVWTYHVIINKQSQFLDYWALKLPPIPTRSNWQSGKNIFIVGRRDNTLYLTF